MEVTDLVAQHDHELSEELYKNYKEVRRLTQKERSEAEKLIETNVPTANIVNLVRNQTGKAVRTRDILNIRAQLKHDATKGKSKENLIDNVLLGKVLYDPFHKHVRTIPSGKFYITVL